MLVKEELIWKREKVKLKFLRVVLKEIVLIADMQTGMIQRTESHIARGDMGDIIGPRIEMAVFIGTKSNH